MNRNNMQRFYAIFNVCANTSLRHICNGQDKRFKGLKGL